MDGYYPTSRLIINLKCSRQYDIIERKGTYANKIKYSPEMESHKPWVIYFLLQQNKKVMIKEHWIKVTQSTCPSHPWNYRNFGNYRKHARQTMKIITDISIQ